MHDLLFRLIRQRQSTVLLAAHDVDEAIKLADRVLVMEDGSIVVERPVALAHPRLRDLDFETLRGELVHASFPWRALSGYPDSAARRPMSLPGLRGQR